MSQFSWEPVGVLFCENRKNAVFNNELLLDYNHATNMPLSVVHKWFVTPKPIANPVFEKNETTRSHDFLNF
jgi:hypothetical protein